MITKISAEDIPIRSELRPGDIGYVIQRHGTLYAEEYNYGISFEAYVAKGLHEFYQSYDPALDRVWIPEHNGKIIGFLSLMHRPANLAQLRYFFLEAGYRGVGLGKKLMDLYMQFLKEAGYGGAYLWTTNEQTDAARLYKHYGFKLTEEKESDAFGKKLIEQRYDFNC